MSDDASSIEPRSPAAGAPMTPQPPRRLEVEERSRLESSARELVARVSAAPEDRQLAREVTALGGDAQRKAAHEMDLLKTKVGTLLKDMDGPGAKIPQGLVELRRTMDEINPHALMAQPRGFFSRLFRKAPVIGDVLADIAVRYESVQTQIDAIVGGLRGGKDELLQDSVELEQLYRQVQHSQREVQKAAFLGELIWKDLEAAKAAVEDPAERQRLDTIIHRVAMRVQDLRTMEQVNTQFFVSIDMTIQNNDHLSDAITRTITVTQSLLTVGLAIQAALANQKKVMGAVQQTQAYTSDMLAANAAAIRQQTTEIGDLYKDPVLALDKVKTAYEDLVSAMDEMDEIRRAGTESARAGIAKLTEMTSALAPRAEALESAREFEVPDVPSQGS